MCIYMYLYTYAWIYEYLCTGGIYTIHSRHLASIVHIIYASTIDAVCLRCIVYMPYSLYYNHSMSSVAMCQP